MARAISNYLKEKILLALQEKVEIHGTHHVWKGSQGKRGGPMLYARDQHGKLHGINIRRFIFHHVRSMPLGVDQRLVPRCDMAKCVNPDHVALVNLTRPGGDSNAAMSIYKVYCDLTVEGHGVPPSMTSVADVFGTTGTIIRYHVKKLTERGLLIPFKKGSQYGYRVASGEWKFDTSTLEDTDGTNTART